MSPLACLPCFKACLVVTFLFHLGLEEGELCGYGQGLVQVLSFPSSVLCSVHSCYMSWDKPVKLNFSFLNSVSLQVQTLLGQGGAERSQVTRAAANTTVIMDCKENDPHSLIPNPSWLGVVLMKLKHTQALGRACSGYRFQAEVALQ